MAIVEKASLFYLLYEFRGMSKQDYVLGISPGFPLGYSDDREQLRLPNVMYSGKEESAEV